MRRLGKALQAYNRQARTFFLVVIALGFAIDGIYTVLLNLYLLRLGYGTEFIGLINAVGLLTFALTSLPAGIVGSRVSSTLMMKVGAFVVLIGGGLLPFAESVPATLQDVWLVVLYGVMFGGFSLFFVNGAPFLMNIVPEGRENDAFALQTAMLAFAGFIGSLVGGIVPEFLATVQGLSLDDPAPYRITFMITSVVLVMAFLLVLTVAGTLPTNQDDDVPSDTMEKRKPAPVVWTMPLITLVLVMTFVRLFQVAGSATVVVYFNVYMDTQLLVSTGVIGAIAAVGRLTGIPTALMTPALVKRWGNVNVVIWSATATALFMFPLALIEHWSAAAVGFIGVTAMNSIRFTAFLVYILGLVSKRQQAVMSGSGEMAGGFSFSMMALGGGIILSLFTFRDLFLLGAIFTLLGTFIFWIHYRVTRPQRKVKPALNS